jgi:hypothetical protein
MPDEHADEMRTTKKRPLADVAALLRALLSPSLRRPTLILWLVFFANAFTYYGELGLALVGMGFLGSFTSVLRVLILSKSPVWRRSSMEVLKDCSAM